MPSPSMNTSSPNVHLNKDSLKTFPKDHQTSTICEILKDLSTYNSGEIGLQHEFQRMTKNWNEYISEIKKSENYKKLEGNIIPILEEMSEYTNKNKTIDDKKDKIASLKFLNEKVIQIIDEINKRIALKEKIDAIILNKIKDLAVKYEDFYKAKNEWKVMSGVSNAKLERDGLELQINAIKFKTQKNAKELAKYKKESSNSRDKLKKIILDLEKKEKELQKKKWFIEELKKICKNDNELDKILDIIEKAPQKSTWQTIIDKICRLFFKEENSEEFKKLNKISQEKKITPGDINIKQTDIEKLQSEIKKLEKEIEESDKKIDNLNEEINKQRPKFLTKNEKTIEDLEEKIEMTEKEIKIAEKKQKNAEKKFEDTEKEYKDTKKDIIDDYKEDFPGLKEIFADEEKRGSFDIEIISAKLNDTITFDNFMEKYIN